MKRFGLIAFLVLLPLLLSVKLHAQRAMTPEELVDWKRITSQKISDDGKWVSATVAPWEGDSSIRLFNSKGKEIGNYEPAGYCDFSASSNYALIRLVPAQALTDSLKLAKSKKTPMNSLLIRKLPAGEEIIDSIKSYKISAYGDWLAYKRREKDDTLRVRTLDGKSIYVLPEITEFGFIRETPQMYYVTKGDTLGTVAGLYFLNLEDGGSKLIKEGKENYKSITFNEEGDLMAFLFHAKKDSLKTAAQIWLSENGAEARPVVSRENKGIPDGWVVSDGSFMSFSKSGRRLYFYTAPPARLKDTTKLESKRPKVQVWSWDEPVQYTVQDFNKSRDMNRTYQAVYDLRRKSVVRLADELLTEVLTSDEGDGRYGMGADSAPYSLSSMWEGKTKRDVYLISLEDGSRRMLMEASYDMPRFSPKGNFVVGYSRVDSLWFSIDLLSGKRYDLTSPATFTAWDEEFDSPDYPNAYGMAGWAEEDGALFLYDRYDIWRFDPRGAYEPVRLTNGREQKIRYRYVRLDREERFIDVSKPQFLTGFNEVTKGHGYYTVDLTSPHAPKALLAGNFALSPLVKAKDSDNVIYTRETYEQFPELMLSDLKFKKSSKLTGLGDQQKGIRWGKAELVSWISLDGKRIEGVVYKPADFDPKKKYPLLVNFYERNSETLYRYKMPEPGRSTIDYRMYNSNEYIIFNPDVVYGTGYPGEDCFNCVMPGISMLIQQGFVDEKAIGAQGHSWGGYQVAYLATRTDLFAAIESGAPVVNMFSAYGGIRWGSGLARSFQYEHTQSRIGGNPWNAPREFFESSPLFHMDKVTTPILIMHNDKDGHVPWYQGIEYFVALKRLGKPAWLLNYTGEIHWPGKMPNRIDFQKRMFQFFNHYLKGEAMPRWMSEGVPAVDSDFELGYELEY